MPISNLEYIYEHLYRMGKKINFGAAYMMPGYRAFFNFVAHFMSKI